MIRLRHVSGSLRGQESRGERGPLRIGRAAGCDILFGAADEAVSAHHAQIVFEKATYFLIDTGSTNGTLVNGRRIQKQALKAGDRVRFGFPGGPEAFVELEVAAQTGTARDDTAPTVFVEPGPNTPKHYDAGADAAQLASVLSEGSRDSVATPLAVEAAERVAAERARAGGHASGKTMAILADSMHQMSRRIREKTRRRWVKVVAIVGGVGLVSLLVAGGVIFWQQREINQLIATKQRIDAEIHSVEAAMQAEEDPAELELLDQRLARLTGRAETALAKLSQADSTKAAEVAAGADQLDRDIHQILDAFGANTYTIPPIFRERLQYHIDQLVAAGPTLRIIYRRRQQYWPVIAKEFAALGLPQEMAYIAWAESQFDPEALSGAGARGMWQMMPATARGFGLRVDDQVDERTDVAIQTRAAARYLANLLAEFGEDSFMLAMAAYNRGEGGVRRALHQVAAEPGGFRREKRDFWHLYRIKKLPPETREYVPKVLAAAIVASHPERYGL